MRSLERFSQEELDRALEYCRRVWWLRFDAPCTGLWVPKDARAGNYERVAVCAALIGMGKSLPDGWANAGGPNEHDWFSLGKTGVCLMACHETFLERLMRAVWRSGYDGTLRRAGTDEDIGFRDLTWRERVLEGGDA